MCDCIEPGDKVLSIMPIFHGFGLGICIHTVICAGATAVILPQFDVNTFDKLLKNISQISLLAFQHFTKHYLEIQKSMKWIYLS